VGEADLNQLKKEAEGLAAQEEENARLRKHVEELEDQMT
jgi:hypothetical protein